MRSVHVHAYFYVVSVCLRRRWSAGGRRLRADGRRLWAAGGRRLLSVVGRRLIS